MPKAYPMLTCQQVKAILKNLGFEPREQKGSHQHWVKDVGGKRYKVTVDCPKAPFSAFLLKSMIRQSGVGKDEFLSALK